MNYCDKCGLFLSNTPACDVSPICDACTVKLLRERVKRLEEALERIARYPIHSEPIGGAMDMQDIASKAITKTEDVTLHT